MMIVPTHFLDIKMCSIKVPKRGKWWDVFQEESNDHWLIIKNKIKVSPKMEGDR